jgi:hypothetical protein
LEFLLSRVLYRDGRGIDGMKKIVNLVIVTVVVLGAGKGLPAAYAQDVVGLSLSLGPEVNVYSPEFVAVGLRARGDYRFGEMLAIGTSFLFCSEKDLTTLEFSGNVRYYLLRDEASLIKFYNMMSVFHFFLQAEGGAAAFIDEKNSLQPHFMGGIAAGSRIALDRVGSFYIEPYLRLGYPYIFGVGVVGVYRFPLTGVFW